MQPGSVIVDLAVEQGGNVEGAVAGEVVERHGVKIVGHRNVPSRLAADTSALFARNLYNFLSAFWDAEAKAPVLARRRRDRAGRPADQGRQGRQRAAAGMKAAAALLASGRAADRRACGRVRRRFRQPRGAGAAGGVSGAGRARFPPLLPGRRAGRRAVARSERHGELTQLGGREGRGPRDLARRERLGRARAARRARDLRVRARRAIGRRSPAISATLDALAGRIAEYRP